jgi:hypothetical protein
MLPIPIGDITRARSFPIVNVALIALNVLVFLWEISLGTRGFQTVTLAYGNIPYEILTGRDLQPFIPYPVYVTFLTAMFMHGGWLHLFGNMLYLWVFGDNVEDLMGTPYLVFTDSRLASLTPSCSISTCASRPLAPAALSPGPRRLPDPPSTGPGPDALDLLHHHPRDLLAGLAAARRLLRPPIPPGQLRRRQRHRGLGPHRRLHRRPAADLHLP